MKIKKWNFNSENMEKKREEMLAWIEKWQGKYEIREIFVNSAYAVEYRPLRVL